MPKGGLERKGVRRRRVRGRGWMGKKAQEGSAGQKDGWEDAEEGAGQGEDGQVSAGGMCGAGGWMGGYGGGVV